MPQRFEILEIALPHFIFFQIVLLAQARSNEESFVNKKNHKNKLFVSAFLQISVFSCFYVAFLGGSRNQNKIRKKNIKLVCCSA